MCRGAVCFDNVVSFFISRDVYGEVKCTSTWLQEHCGRDSRLADLLREVLDQSQSSRRWTNKICSAHWQTRPLCFYTPWSLPHLRADCTLVSQHEKEYGAMNWKWKALETWSKILRSFLKGGGDTQQSCVGTATTLSTAPPKNCGYIPGRCNIFSSFPTLLYRL